MCIPIGGMIRPMASRMWWWTADRKSTRLNSSHTEIYTLSLHDALPIYPNSNAIMANWVGSVNVHPDWGNDPTYGIPYVVVDGRSEEHTSELQSHRDLHSFPTRRSSDLSEFERDHGKLGRFGECASRLGE